MVVNPEKSFCKRAIKKPNYMSTTSICNGKANPHGSWTKGSFKIITFKYYKIFEIFSHKKSKIKYYNVELTLSLKHNITMST